MNPFQIMSEPIRRRIIEVLASGEHTSGELTAVIVHEFGVTRAAVSRHLKILRDNEWVHVHAEFTTRIYRLDDTAWRKLDREVRRLKRLWKSRIGFLSNNDTPPWLKRPAGGRRYPRLEAGVAKGLRGRARRDNPWAPRPKRPNP